MEPAPSPTIDMTASQHALELRKFFEPFYPLSSSGRTGELRAHVDSDGALDAFAETVVWRLQGVHSMVSLVDGTTQYFLAGAIRRNGKTEDGLIVERAWFGCESVPTPGGLCENTLAVNCNAADYPCFVVNDLQADERFARLPVVDGILSSYRFYAGTPITTAHGINIGSLFVFGDRPRPGGLILEQKKFLFQVASNVMKHLQTRREAAERRRVSFMSRGISRFLETTSRLTEASLLPKASEKVAASKLDQGRTVVSEATPAVSTTKVDLDSTEGDQAKDDDGRPLAGVVDQIKSTLDRAAELLRESFELNAGGVVFFDTALGHRDDGVTNYFDLATDGAAEDALGVESLSKRGSISPGQVRTFNAQFQPAKVLAMSLSDSCCRIRWPTAPDGKTLQTLISLYPKGNIWYIDDGGFFSSVEQVDALSDAHSPTRRISEVPSDLARQRAEADVFAKLFHKARQIIFLPLWDAGGNRWYSGCFVWTQCAVPVFSADPDISYLSALTNSMMVEISRLEAITANKMKSDFISSISHEFRSPLHGILASTDFLRDSELDSMQVEFISTIQNCGSTLLDTINHVLDYSKINSFEKRGRETGSLSNELYQTNNVAFLCEEIVYGMMAAKEFQGMPDSISPRRPSIRPEHVHSAVHIILDFESRNWIYEIQSGALRRIIMNIVGNAHKYTDTGYILVQLRVREETKGPCAANNSCPHVLVMKVIDSGRGISKEYMERKLFTPFAQEDTFSPGIGLGLSIVWSIVNQLGGMIHIRSELGQGTEVEVTLPLGRRDIKGPYAPKMRSKIEGSGVDEAKHCLEAVQEIASGRTVAILRQTTTQGTPPYIELGWKSIEKYFSDWFGFETINLQDGHVPVTPDLIITEKLAADFNPHVSLGVDASRVLLVREGMTCVRDRKPADQTRSFETIWSPIGPHKLARAVLQLFRDQPGDAVAPIMSPLSTVSETTEPPLTHPAFSISSPSEAKEIISEEPKEIDVPTDRPLMPMHTWSGFERANSPKRIEINTNSISQISTPDSGASLALKNMPSLSVTQSSSSEPPNSMSSPDSSLQSPSSNLSPIPTTSETKSETTVYILAVDDNILNLQLLHRYLIKRPQDIVTTAKNGVEAVSAVRQAKVPFDVILMDLSMPEMDGFEATRLIRLYECSLRHREASDIYPDVQWPESRHDAQAVDNQDETNREEADAAWVLCEQNAKQEHRQQNAYIVALTGLASRRDRDEAEHSGFDDFLTKPISFARIGELLAQLSAEKLQRASQ